MELRENSVEFITGQKEMTFTFTNRKHINRVKSLYESRPEDFIRFYENPDGSVCGTVPLSWLKINPPKQVSDEFRQAASDRLRSMRRSEISKNE